ncbi:uncharacterized protein DUF1413 [Mobilisporobacter senegalensis]|uniref:Uncharacterized protein DUF1413 n=1 Tax=Mobilisporobacter senegalensis TaxID=1329262 RepID=A0A3N1XN31_9FIRM|nr:DUF1413 domain-containing protein [Mobilisporobacter senegalensis]ROR28110.1 uncharacterized protein DUF1413 [Mobilisporobacter senegalensis]
MASKIIQISFSEAEYSHLESKAEEEGMTIALYIKNKVLDDTEFKKWFRELLERVSRIKYGTPFNIKMVLSTDWVNIERGVRLAMGRAFYNYVVAGKVEGVKPTQKDSANVQWYEVGGEE